MYFAKSYSEQTRTATEHLIVGRRVEYTMSVPKLRVNELVKSYLTADGRLLVLDNISFSVREREFVSIVGPSGCGKTTLLRIVAGLTAPDSGEVLINEVSTRRHNKRVGFIFQQESLFPWKSVRKNIEFGLEIEGVARDRRRELSDRMIELIRMRGYENHLPHQISGGQARKVEMARGLITQPDVLVSDEVFSNLDAQTRNYLQAEFLRIWQETASTILFVTHNVDEAVFMSDRILVLSNIPARIIGEFRIDIPRPRDRTGTDCLEYRAKVLEVLRVEQEKALARQGL